MPRTANGNGFISNRHVNDLLTRLEQVVTRGHVEMRQTEILTWYGQNRFTVGIWQDILERWDEWNYGVPLLAGKQDGVWVLVWGEGLTTSDDSWLKDIRNLATKKNNETDFGEARGKEVW